MTHREIIARALWECDRKDFGPDAVIHSTDPLDEGWGYLEQADAILADIEKRGLCIVPVEPGSHDEADERCKELVRSGELIQAVKLYRRFFGTSLKDTYEIINRMRAEP